MIYNKTKQSKKGNIMSQKNKTGITLLKMCSITLGIYIVLVILISIFGTIRLKENMDKKNQNNRYNSFQLEKI